VRATACLGMIGALLVLAGCGADHRQTAEKTLREIGPTALRRDAAGFYKQLFVAPTGQYFLPKLDHCPSSFQRFHPLRVRAYADGFGLALADVRGLEEGLYVVPLGMDNAPRASRHAIFERIDDGLYWYSFTEQASALSVAP